MYNFHLIYKNLLFKLIVLSLIIVNIFFYVNSRVYVNIYTVQPINKEIIQSTISGSYKKKIQLFKDAQNNYAYDDHAFNILSERLNASIIRFLQNNKTYRYLFIKEKNLSIKDQNVFNLVLKNINLEGAYFLNPAHLSTVQISFYNIHDDEKKIFEEYLDFIVEKEILNKINERIYSFDENKALVQYRYDIDLNINTLNDFITFVKYYIEKKSYDPQFNISDIEYTNIKTSIEKVDLIYQDYKSHKKYNSIKRKELSEALNRIFLNFENLKISDYNGYKIIQETKKIINNDFVKNFFDQWEINSTISDKSFFFNEKNFDINQLKKNILNSYKFQEKRFNYKEWLSLNIFSIVFAFVIYFIYKNFKKN